MGGTGAASRCSKATSLQPTTLISGGCLVKPSHFPLQRLTELFKSVLQPSFLPGNKPRPGDSVCKKSRVNGQWPKLAGGRTAPSPPAGAGGDTTCRSPAMCTAPLLLQNRMQ